MPVRLLGLFLACLVLASCSTADLPGFADAAVHRTTGVNPQERLERQMNTNLRIAELEAEREAALRAQEEANAEPDPLEDSRSLASMLEQYSNWATVLVAGDYRSAIGTPTDGFDNARRTMAQNLTGLGFRAENMSQLSVRPDNYDDAELDHSNFDTLRFGLQSMRQQADEGCLVYITSHGSALGVTMGDTGYLTPDQLNEILDNTCLSSPTILIVSACYSGIFATGDLLQPNRMIMTAARSDRTSFGCGQDDFYPYFDGCMFDSFPQSADWIDFARRTLTCVEVREQLAGLTPPSSPQVYIGTEIRDLAITPFLSMGFGL